MKKRVVILSLCFLVPLNANRAVAQDLDKVWVQGQSVVYTTTFNGTAPPNNQKVSGLNSLYFSLGSSNICDSAGNLVLLCDGYNLYDKNRDLIEDGDTIIPSLFFERYNGSTVYAQTSIILPFGNGKYRVVTPTASDSEVTNYWWSHPEKGRALFDLLLYHEVDMNANAGGGKVTRRMMPLLENVKLSKTQMMACQHGDGKSWWLLKQASDTNMVYKFLFTEDKIYGPYLQGFPEPHFTKWDVCGQAMFSKDGTKYATTIQGLRKIFLADFDRCNGILSDPKVIDVPMQLTQNPSNPTQGDSSTCGLAFSPNGRFLYVNGFFTVQQLDLLDSNPGTAWTTLSGPDTTWREFQSYSNIYPGPDGKLYIGNWNGLGGQMSTVETPDSKGTACNFCRKCLRFPGYVYQGITRFASVASPPCMPNYHLGPTTPICYPTSVNEPVTGETDFLLYPNPSNRTIEVKYKEAGALQLYDVTGRIAGRFSLPEAGSIISIDLGYLPAGIYQYRYIGKNLQRMSGKLMVTR